jgi:hypothetical protein
MAEGTTTTRLFVGDAEHDLALTPPMILELERLTGRGIGGTFKRLVASEFSFAEVTEVIRLGLVGGGMEPKRAAEIVETYVKPRPLAETFPTALSIMEAAWFGPTKPEATE